MRITHGIGLLCLLGLAMPASAQAGRPDLVGVKAWRGTLTASARQADDTLVAGTLNPTQVKVSYTGSFTAEVLLDQFEDEPAVWTGKVLSSNLSVSCSTEVTGPKVKVETSYSTSGPADARDGPEAKLTFHRERGWSLYVLRNDRRAEETKVTTIEGKVFTEKHERGVHALKNVRKFPYPAEGFDLVGEAELTPSESAGDFPIIWKYKVHLWPADREVLTLEIEDSAAYREWRPSTTPDAKPGQSLDLKATVVSSDGKTPNKKVESFVWELEKTSREPGVSMNYPLNATDDRLDMELTTQGGFFVVSPDAQRVERAVSEGFSDTVTVLPFDWGGWADLKITAVLVGGEKLVGKVKGAAEDGLRLPKRAANSYVADSWKKGKTGTGPDDCDFDDKPAIPSHKGDGLTLYEEYRGFYEKGQHKEGDPATKDLFVLDKTKGQVEGGLRMFQGASEVLIHRLEADEMSAKDRLVNGNRAKGPHVVAQHGLLIEFLDPKEGAGFMGTDPQGAASPGEVKAIYVPEVSAADRTPYLDASFAHEMLHAVGVRHHGDGDYDAYWKIVGDAVLEFRVDDNGEILAGAGVPITIENESGAAYTANFIAHRRGLAGSYGTDGPKKSEGQFTLVGVEHGQSSGDDTCFMRYDRNGSCLKAGEPGVRVLIQKSEPVGHRICTSSAGTGINFASPGPSRYGDASPGRGNCKSKIKISDL